VRGEKTPCAIVVGGPPCAAFMGPQKPRLDVDEMEVAGGLAGEPMNMVRAVDLMVPAKAELVIEGLIDLKILEPEGPFVESHGHVALEEFNMPLRAAQFIARRT
jgi:4-hydroxy-3-polyprenylbenzoate decarboxylase